MHIAFLLLAHAFIHVLVSPAINDMEDVSYITAEHRIVASFSTKFLKLNIFIPYHSMNQNTHQTPRVLHMCFIYYSCTDNILNTLLTACNSGLKHMQDRNNTHKSQFNSAMYTGITQSEHNIRIVEIAVTLNCGHALSEYFAHKR